MTEIGQIKEQKYLGFVLSNTGDNMANIREVKKKSIGIVKSALDKLNSLNLKQYYFECSIIILNVMVRSSILYASEFYYDLKESEVRHLERIEEKFIRKVLNTTKGCRAGTCQVSDPEVKSTLYEMYSPRRRRQPLQTSA